jgi:hypothetical protein
MKTDPPSDGEYDDMVFTKNQQVFEVTLLILQSFVYRILDPGSFLQIKQPGPPFFLTGRLLI